jgi:hypothetical protein
MPSPKPLSKEALVAIADPTPLKPPLSFYPSSRIRSTNFAVRGGKLLSDKKILQYAREGKYGTEFQDRALAHKSPKQRAKVKNDLLARALKELLKGKV